MLLMKIFTEVGEACMKLFTAVIAVECGNPWPDDQYLVIKHIEGVNLDVDTAKNQLATVQNLQPILTAVNYPDPDVVKISYRFFNEFANFIYNQSSMAVRASFQNEILALIKSLWKQLAVDEDTHGIINSDHDSYEFRKETGNLIQGLAFIPGAETTTREIWKALTEDGAGSWTKQEASLEVISCIADQLNPNESTVVPDILESVIQMQGMDVHVAFKATGTKLIGNLAEWIGCKSDTDTISKTMKFIIEGLEDKVLAPVTAKAFRCICQSSCKRKLAPFVDQLTTLVKDADNKHNLPHDSTVALYSGISSILTSQPASVIMPKLMELLELIVYQLSLEENQRIPPIKIYDKLAAVYRALSDIELDSQNQEISPVYEPLKQTWPFFKENYRNFGSEHRCSERWCRLIRFGIRSLQKRLPSDDELIPQIAEFLGEHFGIFKQSAILYLGSIVIDDFHGPHSVKMFNQMVAHALEMTKNISINEIPEEIDDLFRLCTRLMQTDYKSFMTSPHASDLVNLAMECFSVQQRDAHTSAMKFLIEIVMLADEQINGRMPGNECVQVYEMFAKNMIDESLNALVHVLPSSMVGDIADLYFSMKQYDIQKFELMFNDSLNKFIQKPNNQAHIQRNGLYDEPVFSKLCLRHQKHTSRHLGNRVNDSQFCTIIPLE